MYYAPRVEIGTTNTLSFLLYANVPVAVSTMRKEGCFIRLTSILDASRNKLFAPSSMSFSPPNFISINA